MKNEYKENLLCSFWVFSESRQQNKKSQLVFLVTSAVGLFLNEILMFLFRIIGGEDQILIWKMN